MEFQLLSDHPNRFCPCLIRRDLEVSLRINGVVHHGLTERRSEFVLGVFSGLHWLGRESHWVKYAEIPAENTSHWSPAKLFAPESLKPVLVILPQAVVMRSLTIRPGLNFGMLDDRFGDKTWRIYQRIEGARLINSEEVEYNRCWISIGLKQISSWMSLPELELNERLRTDN